MSKKMCGLFVVPLLLACVLLSCKKSEPEPLKPPEPTKTSTFVPPVEPPDLEKRGHCLQVTGFTGDEKGEYRYCYYPYKKSDVGGGRSRCSTAVAECLSEPPSGECAKNPSQQTRC